MSPIAFKMACLMALLKEEPSNSTCCCLVCNEGSTFDPVDSCMLFVKFGSIGMP